MCLFSTLKQLPKPDHNDYNDILNEHKKMAKYIVNHMIGEKRLKILIEKHPKKQFKINKLLFPINLGQKHWIYGRLMLKDKIISINDSWRYNNEQNMKHEAKIFYYSMGYLIPQYLASKTFVYHKLFDLKKNNCIMKKREFNGVIKQYNGSDCGVYVCLMMEAEIKNLMSYVKLESSEIYQHGRIHILGRILH